MQQSAGSVQKMTPIPVIHQKTAQAAAATGSSAEQEKELATLRAMLEQQDKQRQEERRAQEETSRQHADFTRQMTALKKQHADQSALLTSSRDTLADVKAKYDSSAASWSAEKDLLQKNIRQVCYCPGIGLD